MGNPGTKRGPPGKGQRSKSCQVKKGKNRKGPGLGGFLPGRTIKQGPSKVVVLLALQRLGQRGKKGESLESG